MLPLPPLCSVTFQSYGERRVQTALLLTAQSMNAATSNDGGRATLSAVEALLVFEKAITCRCLNDISRFCGHNFEHQFAKY